ncbi:MAG: hypothetical protein KDA81_14205, partial [Planctomycetaceae bacterium]|nr:hypothetical protein [Planctomycetaceae bacterium]
MDQQKRTKVLGGVLAGVLGFMAIRPDQVLLNPVRDAQRRLDIANSDFERADAKQTQLMIARERIERARATSLPPRVSDAQRLYQTWITNLAEQCRFAQLQVVPGRTDYRRDQFLTVNVDLEAETDLAGLSRFLYLFEQADLQHRIAELDIRSTGSQNNPRLEINLTAEGMSVARSPEHSEVFPRTVSPQAVTAAATELTVESIDGFPKETPFLVQLGREMVQVTAADEHKWTVIRGQEGTSAVEHAVGESVQLFPIPILKRGNSFDSYEQFLAGSPFTKPAPPKVFRPRLASISDKTIAPGESVSMTAKAEDFNPDVGTPVFALEAAAEGMSINAETGEIQWNTS